MKSASTYLYLYLHIYIFLYIAQLICPVSFDDSAAQVWPLIENDIISALPLRDVVWKSNLSSTLVNVSKLPLRFLPSTASLFKDTDHPFRWFLAPYVNLYLIPVESLEAYRHVKPKIKAWVDNYNGVKRYVVDCMLWLGCIC